MWQSDSQTGILTEVDVVVVFGRSSWVVLLVVLLCSSVFSPFIL